MGANICFNKNNANKFVAPRTPNDSGQEKSKRTTNSNMNKQKSIDLL